MGLLNILSPITNLMGGKEPKAIETPTTVKPAADTAKTPEQIAADAEKKRQAAVLAANAGGAAAQTTTVGGGSANVTRKNLLGL